MFNLLISKELGLNTLKEIINHYSRSSINVLTIEDQYDSRSRFQDIINTCKNNNILPTISFSKDDTHNFLLSNKDNFTIVACWYQLILLKTLTELEKPIVGIHNSILPKFRGGSPLVWTILSGEKLFGYSVFEISEGLDDGKIYLQKEFLLESDMDVKTCMDIIQSSFISNLKNIVSDMINGISPTSQAKEEATYCSQRLPIDGLIDWNQTNLEIHNFIRSQSYPYPGSYSFLNGKKIIFQKSKLIDDVCYGKPGQIYQLSKDGMTIVCSKNSLIFIEKIIFEGNVLPPNKIVKSVRSRFDNIDVFGMRKLLFEEDRK